MLATHVLSRYIPGTVLGAMLACVAPMFCQDSMVFTSAGQPQPLNRSAARRTVTGTVINSATEEPIRRALVRVNGAEQHVAFTGADGRFEIPNMPEGQVFLSAQKPGFFDPESNAGGSQFRSRSLAGSNANINLSSGTGDVVLKLAPEARISGHVLDTAGEPVPYATIYVQARVIVEGRKEWQPRGQANTDETGAYLVENLMPGIYAVGHTSLPAPPPVGLATGAKSRLVFPNRYYPDSPDLASAQTVDLKPGQDLSVDFALSPVPGFRISGTVTGSDNRFWVICEDSNGEAMRGGLRVDPRTGKFTIESVPAGSWIVHASSQGGPNGPTAEQLVEVTSSDVQGLVLSLEPSPSIPVHVENRPEGQNIMLSLIPDSPVRLRGRRLDAARQQGGDAADSLTFQSVPPGKYRLSSRLLDNSACIASVTSGSLDLSRDELNVVAGSQPAPIEVTLRSDCATISGSVHPSSEQPAASFVLLLPDSPVASPQVIPAGTDGKFFFSRLTPGDYRLYAFNDVSNLEYGNPEALRDFISQQVSAGPNDKATVQLDLVTRAK